MQPTSEKYSYLEELRGEEDSLKESRFCFNQMQDTYFHQPGEITLVAGRAGAEWEQLARWGVIKGMCFRWARFASSMAGRSGMSSRD